MASLQKTGGFIFKGNKDSKVAFKERHQTDLSPEKQHMELHTGMFTYAGSQKHSIMVIKITPSRSSNCHVNQQ